MSTHEDSVPLESFGESSTPKKDVFSSKEPRLRLENLKLIFIIFVIFLVVVSSPFTNSVIAGFGEKAVRCRAPTSWGIVLQGLCLVIFYILAAFHLYRHAVSL